MKNIIFAFIFAMISTTAFGQSTEKTYQLSSHILDVSKGMPAAGVTIKLEKYIPETKTWAFADEKVTDKNGRVPNFLDSSAANNGTYKLTYYTKEYFQKSGTESFYPWVEVVFQIADNTHYHVPITLSAYGYSTYRGN